jgi:crotonobetainyl-CoA:carnitine CoA-transferase CaiB-like acyl-CoA transferase
MSEFEFDARRPAPAVGGDSDTILAELGLDAASIAALRSDGVI